MHLRRRRWARAPRGGVQRRLQGCTVQADEPPRARARRYGNTSSASVWYALSYIEACQGVAAGDVVWQVGFGSGFKCNSAVWKARRAIRDGRHAAWAHMVNGNLECVWKYLEARSAQRNPIPYPACVGPRGAGGRRWVLLVSGTRRCARWAGPRCPEGGAGLAGGRKLCRASGLCAFGVRWSPKQRMRGPGRGLGSIGLWNSV